MWLNRQRVLMRRSFAVAAGIGAAFGKKMPPEMLESICDNEFQAKLLAYLSEARSGGNSAG